MYSIGHILEAHGVAYKDSTRPGGGGWLNMNCPWCEDHGMHLGFNTDYGIFSCWRCGRHPVYSTLRKLTGLEYDEVKKAVLASYESPQKNAQGEGKQDWMDMPPEFRHLGIRHKKYLLGRNINPNFAASAWGAKGVDCQKYGRGIALPVFFKTRMRSWTIRSILADGPRYMSCPRDEEGMPIRSLLYGYDLARGRSALLVEGPFDAMRYGPGAVASFGKNVTDSQISLLSGYRNVFICLDSRVNGYGVEEERRAQEAAERVADTLSVVCNVWIINHFRQDVADMGDDQIMRIRAMVASKEGEVDVHN